MFGSDDESEDSARAESIATVSIGRFVAAQEISLVDDEETGVVVYTKVGLRRLRSPKGWWLRRP